MLFGGGSSSSSNSLSFNSTISPILNIGGDGFSGGTNSEATQRTEATATTKDELKLAASAGVALGPNSSAQGGTASLQDSKDAFNDIIPQPVKNALGDNAGLYILGTTGALALGTVGYMVIKKKKKV